MIERRSLREQYNPDGSILRLQQLRMLDILKIIADICDKYEIPYWLSSGTLLGAVRHKGFIPWDDDLDIEILEKDRKKLMRILRRELPPFLKIQTNRTDWNYPGAYMKIRDTYSTIYENNFIDNQYKYRGIYIDIFTVAPISGFSHIISASLHRYLLYGWRALTKKGHSFFYKGFIMRLLMLFVKCIYKLLWLVDCFIPNKRYYYEYGVTNPENHSPAIFFPLKEVEFEGVYFKAPHDTHQYLVDLYGNDYMSLPSEDSRRVHTQRVVIDKFDYYNHHV